MTFSKLLHLSLCDMDLRQFSSIRKEEYRERERKKKRRLADFFLARNYCGFSRLSILDTISRKS